MNILPPSEPLFINIKGELLDVRQPRVMGILNVTPDSFYANSRYQTEKDIVDRIHQIHNEGGVMIDIGAYSSRPDSKDITAEEEMKRLAFALEIINKEMPHAIVSVDTFRANVAKECVETYGVAMINDISGGNMDPNMFQTVAALKVPYILMHMIGTPQTMMQHTHYTHFMEEVFLYFSKKVNELRLLGVNDIILDPGFGFSKTLEANYELMHQIGNFDIFELPLLVGVSRKSMIYKYLEITPEESLNGTTVLNTYALLNGANILRVHDVKAAVEAVQIVSMTKKH